MPTYKLINFNVRGLGEISRYIFEIAGQEYEDIRIPLEDWPAVKETTPLGQLPVLEVDGEKIPQSMAIHRYLARKFGLYGESDIDKARIDVVLEVLNDLLPYRLKAVHEQNPEAKERFFKELHEIQAPKYLALLENLLKANQGGDGFFVGSKMSLADIAVFNWVHDKLPELELFDKVPKLQALADRMKALPEIDAWLKKRPETDI